MNELLAPSPGFVYLAKSPDGLYKIGSSVKPAERVKKLKAELIHTIPTDRLKIAEFRLHQAYMSKWITGEYFALTDDDVVTLKAKQTIAVGFSDGEVALAAAIQAVIDAGGRVTLRSSSTGFYAVIHDIFERGEVTAFAESVTAQLNHMVGCVEALEGEGADAYWGPTAYGDLLVGVKALHAPTWRKTFDATRAAKLQEVAT